MTKLFKNIDCLMQTGLNKRLRVSGKEMSKINSVENAYLLIRDDKILDYGKMTDLPKNRSYDDVEDLAGKYVFPSFCDSHTHLVYAGSREIEYNDKIRGLSYEEIAERGGGILNSSKLINKISEDELYRQSAKRIDEIISQGTGAVEIKSGYGLTVKGELKMLRVIQRLKESKPLQIKATFMGAHSVPMEYRNNKTAYVDLVVNEMLPNAAKENLADYIDVFCDKGFFTPQDTDRILKAGLKYGLRGKIHANELDYSGGIQVGVKNNALSVDHLEYTGPEEIKALSGSETMPVILPGAAFFLNMKYAPARQMIDAGLPVAIATDFNPGSSPGGNMKLMMSFGAVNHKMITEELIHAVTINGAYAMGLSNDVGSITKGKIANFFITKPIPSPEYLAYAYSSDLIDSVYLNGKKQ
ncbi:MAG: imidazolonepropionase [Bacteroidota bacterium]|nr:imidazolonepropionase [Bacteroidota bacterium]